MSCEGVQSAIRLLFGRVEGVSMIVSGRVVG